MRKLILYALLFSVNAVVVLLLVGALTRNGFYENEADDLVIIGACYPSLENAYYEALNEKIDSVVVGNGDVLIARDALMSQAEQNEQIGLLIDRGARGLFVAPVDWTEAAPVLAAARARGIRVVVLDGCPAGADGADCRVAYDDEDAGAQVGRYLAEQVSGARVLLMEYADDQAAADRINGFARSLSARDGFSVVGRVLCEERTESATSAMEEWIAGGVSFDAVFAPSDVSMCAVASVLKAGGMEDVVLVGMGGSPAVKAMIKDGEVLVVATLLPVELGSRAARAMYALLSGGQAERDIMVPTQLLTRQTVAGADIDKWR